MPNLVVGLATVYKCLILFSMDLSPALCVVVLCSGLNRSPNNDLNPTFLVIFATLCTQMLGRCLYLGHD